MDKRYIYASNEIIAELGDAELDAVSAAGLHENVIEPMFHSCTCEGILEEYAQQTGGDLDKAAREWMEENFDALSSAVYACSHLISHAADILVLLPVPKIEKEAN